MKMPEIYAAFMHVPYSAVTALHHRGHYFGTPNFPGGCIVALESFVRVLVGAEIQHRHLSLSEVTLRKTAVVVPNRHPIRSQLTPP